MHYALCKISLILAVPDLGPTQNQCIRMNMHYWHIHYEHFNCTYLHSSPTIEQLMWLLGDDLWIENICGNLQATVAGHWCAAPSWLHQMDHHCRCLHRRRVHATTC